jgi:hypothetical protein
MAQASSDTGPFFGVISVVRDGRAIDEQAMPQFEHQKIPNLVLMVRAAQRIAHAANYCRLDDRRRVSADDTANSTQLWSTALPVFLRFTASPYSTLGFAEFPRRGFQFS